MTKISCNECNAECCRDVSIEVDKPESFDDFETLKWFLAHKNIEIYVDHEGDWMVEFKTDCKNLDENNKCRVYTNRFKICRGHEPDECVINGSGEHFKRVFKKEEDVDEYMKEIGFYEEYIKKKKILN
ncbi:unnamed protein product [marine sediment metagenome]|uniref:Zinc/iron-chelating domain-containing protein n=1 Tax=marine sediment metagenome TaxID=412755 RepID=X0V1V2_9ZZZZ